MAFAHYDVVRVVRFAKPVTFVADSMNQRAPCVGDIATIVEVYDQPPGYELECCDADGVTQWLLAFAQTDVELERVAVERDR